MPPLPSFYLNVTVEYPIQILLDQLAQERQRERLDEIDDFVLVCEIALVHNRVPLLILD
jgi:hypothetical protein